MYEGHKILEAGDLVLKVVEVTVAQRTEVWRNGAHLVVTAEADGAKGQENRTHLFSEDGVFWIRAADVLFSDWVLFKDPVSDAVLVGLLAGAARSTLEQLVLEPWV